jgi:hypothetical protein
MTVTGSMTATTGDYHNWNDNEDHSYRLYLGRETQRVSAVCGNETEGAKGVLEVASSSSGP